MDCPLQCLPFTSFISLSLSSIVSIPSLRHCFSFLLPLFCLSLSSSSGIMRIIMNLRCSLDPLWTRWLSAHCWTGEIKTAKSKSAWTYLENSSPPGTQEVCYALILLLTTEWKMSLWACESLKKFPVLMDLLKPSLNTTFCHYTFVPFSLFSYLDTERTVAFFFSWWKTLGYKNPTIKM